MKIPQHIFIILSIFLLAACGDDVKRSNSCQDVEFDISFSIQVGESACLPDGRSLRLLEARDEFCPCGAVCIWEGQLVIKLETEDTDETEKIEEIGSTKNIPHGNIFEDVTVSDFTYLYNGANDSLPLCEGTYDQEEITIILTLSEI